MPSGVGRLRSAARVAVQEKKKFGKPMKNAKIDGRRSDAAVQPSRRGFFKKLGHQTRQQFRALAFKKYFHDFVCKQAIFFNFK